ncbi:hypothetical protein Tco_1397158 [Tanacetum coccineum]
MFEEQAKHELFETVKAFQACKQEDGKTFAELHAMIKLHEKGIPKKVATPAVLAIRGGKIQKDKKKPQGAKGKDKGKTKLAYAPKAKISPPPKRDNTKRRNAGEASTLSIFTIELYSIPNKSWMYDTGYKTHIFNTTRGLRRRRKLKHGALNLYVGNGMRAVVEAIGSLDLILPNRRVIILDNYHYAPSITRGVVSLSRLVDMHTFINYGISVMKDDVFYFNAILHDGIYEIDMQIFYPNVSSIYNVRNKRAKRALDSTYTSV